MTEHPVPDKPDIPHEPVIRTEAICKSYGNFTALKNVGIEVPKGAIGLLGPNGAGKSTFIKCLLQQTSITSGKAYLLGKEVGKFGREIRKRVGYNPEQDCHIPGMIGCEYVTYCALLSGLPFEVARQRTHEMLDYVGMGQERYRKIETYSTGMRQKIKLAQCLVHDPEIVFLDEPTNGLDPKGQKLILDLIRSLWKDRGISFVLSSHLMHDVQYVCDHIIMIAHGTVLVNENIQQLIDRQTPFAEISLYQDSGKAEDIFRKEGWNPVMQPNRRIRIEHGKKTLEPILNVLQRNNLRPIEIIPNPNVLEDIFVRAMEENALAQPSKP